MLEIVKPENYMIKDRWVIVECRAFEYLLLAGKLSFSFFRNLKIRYIIRLSLSH